MLIIAPHWTDTYRCPSCGEPLGAVGVDAASQDHPKAGDVSVCFGCTAVWEYDYELALVLCRNRAVLDGPEVRTVLDAISLYRNSEIR